MENKILALFKEIMKAPAGQRVVFLGLAIVFGVPVFLGYYYSDVIKENKELKIELKEERSNNQLIVNNYIRIIEQKDAQNAANVKEANNLLNEFKEQVRIREEQRTLEIESELRQLRRGVKQTDVILHRTIQIQKN